MVELVSGVGFMVGSWLYIKYRPTLSSHKNQPGLFCRMIVILHYVI